MLLGLASVRSPSCTVPTCSNSEDISHITQWLMPFRRIAMAVAAATAPAPTRDSPHSHSDSSAVLPTSSADSRVLTTSKPVTRRIWLCAVPMNSCIASLA